MPDCLKGPHVRRFAKFWTRYKGAYVKLSLRVGGKVALKQVRHGKYGGEFHASYQEFTFDGEKLIQHWVEWAKDSEGRSECAGACFAYVAELADKPALDWDDAAQGLKFPAWRDLNDSHYQRAFSAESEGY